MGIKEGDNLTLDFVDGKLVLLPPRIVPNPTDVLSGLAKGIKIREPIREELKEAVAKRIGRKTRGIG